MGKILAYFVGGSHDLQKMWIEESLHYMEVPMFIPAPQVADRDVLVRDYPDGRATEMVCKVERYSRTARLRTKNAYLYEVLDE